MYQHPQLNGPIQVVGDASQQGLFDLLPVAKRCDRPAKPTLNDRDKRLNFPALTVDFARKGQLQLVVIGARCHATRQPSRNRRQDALDAHVFSQPAVVGLRIIAPIFSAGGRNDLDRYSNFQ